MYVVYSTATNESEHEHKSFENFAFRWHKQTDRSVLVIVTRPSVAQQKKNINQQPNSLHSLSCSVCFAGATLLSLIHLHPARMCSFFLFCIIQLLSVRLVWLLRGVFDGCLHSHCVFATPHIRLFVRLIVYTILTIDSFISLRYFHQNYLFVSV